MLERLRETVEMRIWTDLILYVLLFLWPTVVLLSDNTE